MQEKFFLWIYCRYATSFCFVNFSIQTIKHYFLISKLVVAFLADRTARCMIGYWHDSVVCLSVCLSDCPSVCDAAHFV